MFRCVLNQPLAMLVWSQEERVTGMKAGIINLLFLVQALSHVWLFVAQQTDCCMPDFSVPHYIPGLVQTRVHWVGDAVQPSYPLLSSPPAVNIYQHQGVFMSQLCIRWQKYWSFNFSIVLAVNMKSWFPLGLTGLILLSRGLSRVLASTTVQRHQFFSAQLSLWSKSHIHAWLLERP